MQKLKFGDIEGKREACAFIKRQKLRDAQVAAVVLFYRRYREPGKWPKGGEHPLFFPPLFQRFPVSVLEQAARELQAELEPLMLSEDDMERARR